MSRARKLGLAGVKSATWPLPTIIKYAMPFALAGIFVKIYSYIDTLLLKQFHDAVTVGHYAVAYKVTYAFQFLPLAFVAALYPSMSAASAKKETAELRRLLKSSWRLMLMASVPMTALLSSLAAPFIELVYGADFRGSIVPMMILPWVLIPIFLDFPIGSLLNASHRAGLKTTSMGIAMVVNVIANLMLIPSLGAAGAAISGILSFWTLLFVGLWFIRKDMEGMWKWFLGLFLRGAVATGIIWYVMRALSESLPFLTLALLGVALGLIVLYIFGLITPKDIKLFLSYYKRKAGPPPNQTHSPEV
jgi:O-antigen/teichoic acid export membrane protein